VIVEESEKPYLGLYRAFKDLGCALRMLIVSALWGVAIFVLFRVVRGMFNGQSTAMLWAILIEVGIVWFIVAYGYRETARLVNEKMDERMDELNEKMDALKEKLEAVEEKIEEIGDNISK
jgi:hypothetical protein